MRVLIIEDDACAATTMELMLKAEGFNVYTTDLGEEGVELAKIYDYDAITLDLSLPDITGFDVLRQLRVAKIATPIMIITNDDSVETKVRALGGGADDYLSKPFHKDELVVRLRGLIRRSNGHAEAKVVTGNITVNLDAKTVEVGLGDAGRRVHLTGKEYQMMELLALRKGTALTKEMFLNHLYGGMDEPELKIIDVFICKLRKKLSEAGATDHIHTVWGRGYVLRDEVSSSSRAVAAVGRASPPLAKMPAKVAGILALASEPLQTFEVAERLGVEYSSVSGPMQRLMADGYAHKPKQTTAAGGSGGRRGYYALTPNGVAWLYAIGWKRPEVAA